MFDLDGAKGSSIEDIARFQRNCTGASKFKIMVLCYHTKGIYDYGKSMNKLSKL